ncbi:bifunctional phosphopantothenoylcysteine decarboxylase/phosphopantothenate--cysteine ligase CoaBC [Acetobacter orleanensis]|uniref:Coenzyme A biosynthesis bifunctional protein CoaBC n=1 Tax=Acetobacter orleanensis TaxID=104099 RepID=A0A4Y3TL65_9PROT|nr:bifunctional phosphopantothenoylcysteine decarboxylase/phosphopantothenate--cysteine ligase CoaBC [Acetobacter orleanensis]KXV63127.1 phosphopantothenoylcysteine synthase [Acetobacter orleanensis]PCD80246.1 bifunctional phosphopantothenoylcysteine decarboxylase/phosphopantothenate--cysteine ligase CoaBC [Acetobacter orleanensis]GAN69017.1 phosphopantothenoylcysteine synthase [Acetobacter orleanensis JCM 7639]GBR30408.1 phosphopantothenoylcysteine synthase [Acetobacter orleanensis NRIC 0473]
MTAALPLRSVLLIVSGSIAAFKAPELIRALQSDGIQVRCVLTEGGSQFVTALTLQALSGQPVYTDLFSLTAEQEMGHIALSRSADLIVVCPASANLLARMAGGLADDLASTVLLATDTPVMVAPGMNVRMWEHPATQANIQTLVRRGVTFIGPVEGEMACGEYGPGRMAEPADVRDAVLTFFRVQAQKQGPLAGRTCLVTAGPTHEPLDPVRYLANRSSGKQGYALAEALADMGAAVTLISGPTTLRPPAGVLTYFCETASQMRDLALAAAHETVFDAAVCTAAVADWRPTSVQSQKIKKINRDDVPPPLALSPNPDILAKLSAPSAFRPHLVIGFAAETETVEAHARAKLARKGCDWIVANNVGEGSDIMGGAENEVTLITQDKVEHWPRLRKDEVARKLALSLADWFLTAHKA